MKLGARLGHWSSLDQVYIDSKGMTGRHVYADWHIPTEEYENYGHTKVASTGTAAVVLGTGAFVGGNHQIDKMQGGPQKRQDARIEQIRQVVREEVYLQLVNAWPKTSGPVKGLVVPKKDYREQVPQQ